MAHVVASRQRFVEDGDGAVGIARPSFSLGQRDLQQSVEIRDVLLTQLLDTAAHVLEPAADRAARSGRPTLQKHSERAPQI